MVHSWHLELRCQPHSYTEPDSLVNWQSFHLLDRNEGILRVTYCTAAAISQTYMPTSLKYGMATSEVHMVVKGQCKKQGIGSRRQPKLLCPSPLVYSTNKLHILQTHKCHLKGSSRMWQGGTEDAIHWRKFSANMSCTGFIVQAQFLIIICPFISLSLAITRLYSQFWTNDDLWGERLSCRHSQ